MVRNSEPKDPRSTYRKRARQVLKETERPEWCEDCGRSPVREDAPGGYFPSMATLEVDHENKVLEDLDPANLAFRCKSCHKESDMRTPPGVSPKGDEYGYGLPTFDDTKSD